MDLDLSPLESHHGRVEGLRGLTPTKSVPSSPAEEPLPRERRDYDSR